jgi:hypothetical protein
LGLENDQAYEIKGVESVRIQMFHGVVRTLTNARFIPDKRKNLISLEILDAKDYIWSAQGGVLWIHAGDKTIIQGLRHRSGH